MFIKAVGRLRDIPHALVISETVLNNKDLVIFHFFFVRVSIKNLKTNLDTSSMIP